jgi:hypothetical protein
MLERLDRRSMVRNLVGAAVANAAAICTPAAFCGNAVMTGSRDKSAAKWAGLPLS